MKEEKQILIGFYKISTLVTYLAVVSGIIGTYLAVTHKIVGALSCLIISGVLDSFDGKIARACKRTEKEKEFGIELDSLADMVSFIFLPIVICYSLNLKEYYHIIIYALYALAGVIRLAYFNVVASETGKDGPVKYYRGLPVPSSVVLLPLLYLLNNVLNINNINLLFTIGMALLSLLFVLNFKLKKPQSYFSYIFLGLGIISIAVLFIVLK